MARALTTIDPLLPIIRKRPLGLFSDVDGTLAPIVPRPEDATVPDSTRDLLQALLAKDVRVGLITGRSLETARGMVGLDEAAYAAQHGLSLWLDGRLEAAPGLAEYEGHARQAERDLRPLCEGAEGIQLESKGPLLAIHYRRARDPAAARESILAALERSQAARRFRVQEGRMVVELRPPVAVDKGTALELLTHRLGVEGVICLGDDITDIDMFAAARRLQARGLAAASVAVAGGEAASEVAAAADYAVVGAEGVGWLLAELVRALP